MDYGLIGNPLGHSLSPKIHGLLGNEAYQCYALEPQEVDAFLKDGTWKGLNVTIPYKETVLPYCDTLSQRAKAIGTVNTLLKKNRKIYGDNTDYCGFLAMAKTAGIAFGNKNVTLFGDGGTGKMAKAAILDQSPKSLTVVSLETPPHYGDLEAYRYCDILVNTTPVGMAPKVEDCLCNLADFPNLQGVLDVIYNPLETRLLKQARALRIPHTNGLYMLIEQARYAEELFFDTAIPPEKTLEIYTELRDSL